MLLRKLLLRSQTAINSDPSVSRKIIYTTETVFGMARISIVRVPKTVVRIACLHVLHSAVSTTAIKFWYGKIKFWYEFWAQFFGQHTKKPLHGTHAAHFIQTWRRKSIR